MRDPKIQLLELKNKLSLVEIVCPDIHEKIQKWVEEHSKIPEFNIQEILLPEVMQQALDKIKCQEDRIATLERLISNANGLDKFVFEPYSVSRHKYKVICSNFADGEYIIKELYNIPNGIEEADICYLTSFGNLVCMNNYGLNKCIRIFLERLNRIESHKAYKHKYRLTLYNNITTDQETIIEHLIGTKYKCMCKCFFNELQKDECCVRENTAVFKIFNYYDLNCAFPYYKWVCNANKPMSNELISKITKHDFSPRLPNYNYIYQKINEFSKFADESTRTNHIISLLEEYNFGSQLQVKVSEFITEFHK